MTSVVPESLLGYHPYHVGFLTCGRKPVRGQCQAGSLTGAVASERVSEAPKGSLSAVGNRAKSVKAEGSLTATPAFRAGRNLPDKEFRYLRTVIVTAAVYWGLNSRRP